MTQASVDLRSNHPFINAQMKINDAVPGELSHVFSSLPPNLFLFQRIFQQQSDSIISVSWTAAELDRIFQVARRMCATRSYCDDSIRQHRIEASSSFGCAIWKRQIGNRR